MNKEQLRAVKDEAERARHEAWQLWNSLKRLTENVDALLASIEQT
jgi:hypothetical protein